MIKNYILLFLLISTSFCCGAQELKNLGIGSQWNKGNITLGDGAKLLGEIRYNDVQGTISFRTSETADDQRLFEKSEILCLEYFNGKDGAIRRYYSLAFKDEKTGDEEINFYELIKEFKDFVVLSRKDAVQAQRTETTNSILIQNGFFPSRGSTLTLTQYEQFYFLGRNSNPELYMIMEYNYVDATLYKFEKNISHISNHTIFPKYLGEYWPRVMQYLKSNKIKLDNREALIRALNFYVDLIGESRG